MLSSFIRLCSILLSSSLLYFLSSLIISCLFSCLSYHFLSFLLSSLSFLDFSLVFLIISCLFSCLSYHFLSFLLSFLSFLVFSLVFLIISCLFSQAFFLPITNLFFSFNLYLILCQSLPHYIRTSAYFLLMPESFCTNLYLHLYLHLHLHLYLHLYLHLHFHLTLCALTLGGDDFDALIVDWLVEQYSVMHDKETAKTFLSNPMVFVYSFI